MNSANDATKEAASSTVYVGGCKLAGGSFLRFSAEILSAEISKSICKD
jgi:hypothetical protein